MPRPIPEAPQVVADAAKRKPLRARRAGWVPSSMLRNRRTHRKRRRALVACDDGAGARPGLGCRHGDGADRRPRARAAAIDADAVMTDARTVYDLARERLRGDGGRLGAGGDVDPPASTSRAAAHELPRQRARSQASCSTSSRCPRTRAGCGRPLPTRREARVRATRPCSRPARAGWRRSGQVGGLGRGERIYAVRFIGDRGYVVTFRQTDPLYTLDLADPAHPRVRGELKILGLLRPTCTRSASSSCSASGRTRRRRASGRARSSRSSTSPTLPPRGCCTVARSERRHHRTSSTTTTRSCGGRPAARGRARGRLRERAARAGVRVPRGSRGRHRRGRVDRGEGRRAAHARRGRRLFTLTAGGLHAYDLDTLAAGPFVPSASG